MKKLGFSSGNRMLVILKLFIFAFALCSFAISIIPATKVLASPGGFCVPAFIGVPDSTCNPLSQSSCRGQCSWMPVILPGSPNTGTSSTFPVGCLPPIGIPSCPGNRYEPDNSCIIGKILDPTKICCPNKCEGTTGTDVTGSDAIMSSVNVFGSTVQYTPDKVPALIQLTLSALLAIVSFYALFRGLFLYAIKRPNLTDAAEVAKLNKEFVNILIGFLLAWSAIFIVEFVMRLLGLPSLTQISVTNIENANGVNVVIIK